MNKKFLERSDSFSYKSNLWDKPKRKALTIPKQKAFMDFIRNDKQYEGWVPVITVLLGTGMRIGIIPGLWHCCYKMSYFA